MYKNILYAINLFQMLLYVFMWCALFKNSFYVYIFSIIINKLYNNRILKKTSSFYVKTNKFQEEEFAHSWKNIWKLTSLKVLLWIFSYLARVDYNGCLEKINKKN